MLAVGTVLQNRYLIEDMLGQGGMGAVYKAVDQRFGSTVALKQMLVSGEALRKAFFREARLLNSLRHQALPVVIDYFTSDDNEAFLVMQYIAGSDLANRLDERGEPFATEEVLLWADQLLDVLDYLHTHEPPVVHRDIKPQNMKVTQRGQVILLDFGLAKGSGAVSSESMAASVLGYTPTYAPFEQIQGTGTDPRSDLYSVAATIYHLMTNVSPVDALTRTAAMLNKKTDPMRPAHVVNPQVPAAVSAVLTQAMSLNSDDRPASAAEMRKALREAAVRPIHNFEGMNAAMRGRNTVADVAAETVVGQAAGTAREPVAYEKTVAPATTPVAEAPPEPAPSSRRMVVVAAALVLAAIAGVVIWLLVGRDKPAPEQPAPVAAKEPAPAAPTGPGGIALKSFSFDVVTVDPRGAVTERGRQQANSFSEALGGGVALDMVSIPGGTFVMGSPDTEEGRFGEEGPQRNVEVPAFYMGKFEVTNAQWQAIANLPKVKIDLNPNPSSFEGVNRPVQSVSLAEAVEFCARLSNKTGREYRLPSEAEWEYACRAGTTTPFHFGETITADLANYDGRSPYGAGPKGTYRKQVTQAGDLGVANRFGLYDMHGSMWEWCTDQWHDTYSGAPLDGSAWMSGGNPSLSVLRGGAWNRPANHCRSAYRLKESPGKRFDVIGFRVVVSAPKASGS
jgi:formylglycine-generating enzyme required for sulfatase activity